MATETQNNKPTLHRKEWQTMVPIPAASAIGTIMVFGKNGANNISMLLQSATAQYLYHHDEDMFIPIASGAFGGTWVAGVCGVYHPWSKTYTATGGSTTTVTVAAASFNINGFARGAVIEFLSGTAGNIGTRTTITEILNNAGQGTITLTLADAVTSVANNDTFRLNTGRFFIMSSGTLASGSFKYFDVGTLSWTTLAFATGGTTNATDARLVVPYTRVDIFDTGTATATSNTTTLVDTTKNWTASQWINYQVRITAGTGKGQVRVITANDATTLTIGSGTDLDATSVYEITGDENAIYYLGNGAVTMYKYSISADSWSTVSVTGARAAAPAAGMTADWVGVTGDTGWANPNACLDGRYIYSARPTSGIIDRYDSASRAWLATTGVNYLPTLTLANGCSSCWDGRYIYLQVAGTTAIPTKIYKYNLRGNYMEPFNEDWYLAGVAVAGNKMWIKDLSSAGAVKWLYYIASTSQVMRRIMIF
jgi:hypothetical protein